MRSGHYRFLNCLADTAARELHRDGKLVELSSPKVFDCLVFLIENRERAVSRDELIAAVWGRSNVSDTQLGQTVLRVRRAIGDDGQEHVAIRTVPRFGYRWIADTSIESSTSADATQAAPPAEPSPPIAISEEAAATTPVSHEIVRPPPAPSRRNVAMLVAALAIAVAIGFALLSGHTRPPTAPEGASATAVPATDATTVPATDGSIAVMPVSYSAGDDWVWLRLGLMDQIDRRLQRAGQAVVPSSNIVALTRAAAQPGTTADAKVRAATGARYLVRPQATRTPSGWRVQLDLHEGGQSRRLVEGSGSDVIVAANAAADRLLIALGKAPPAEPDPSTLPLEQLLQRAEAVLLGSDFDGARRIIESAPPALRDQPAARLMLARIDGRAGNLETTRAELETLLREVPVERDSALRSRVLYALGVVNVREDRSDQALPLLSESLALRLRDNRPADLGEVYTGLAGALINLGRYAEAGDALARARVQLGLAGDTLALARVDANEGMLDIERGRPAEALPLLQRAAECFRLFDVPNEYLLSNAGIVRAQLALLDPEAALATSDSVQAQIDQHETAHNRGTFAIQRANALVANGRLSDASRLVEQLAVEIPENDHTGLPGDIALVHASLALSGGDAATAAQEAQNAVKTLRTVDEQYARARAWRVLAQALRDSGRGDEATLQVRDFSDWARSTSQQAPLLYAALARAEQARDLHRVDDADREYAAALATADAWSVPADLAEVAVSYGNALIADKQLDRAGDVVGRVARWADRDFDCALLQANLYQALGQNESASAALVRAKALAGERKLGKPSPVPLAKAGD